MSNSKSNDVATASASEGLDLSGRTIGDFSVLRRLGQGGMGQVYLAEQISLKRPVALKILRPELTSSATALARFEAEAMAVARATHANIVQVYAYGVEEGLAYMALEYVDGRNLKEYFVRKGPPEVLLAINIMRQVAAALQRAGEMGLIHRDIKPENILLTRKAEVKVADFGLVRCLEGAQLPLNLTQTGVTMGTPLYMSPEQVEGKTVDPRSDIYSFGVTCYHMLAGQPPFVGQSPFEVAVQHVNKEPPQLAGTRPDLPEALCAIVHKMMAKNPADRYQTGKDLLRDIVRLRETLAGAAATQIGPPPLPPDSLPSLPARPLAEAPTTALPTPTPTWVIAAVAVVAVFGSLFVAIGGGMLLARAHLNNKGPLPHGKDIPPADASVVDSVTLPSKEEQTLRNAAELYLNPGKGKPPGDAAGGFGLCMNLGQYYLDHRRLDDADKLFSRLEAFTEPKSYKMLGQIGKGIVLALRDQPKESNASFARVGQEIQIGKGGVGKEKGGGLKKLERDMPQMMTLFNHPRWGYWIRQARSYNKANGLPDREVPLWITRLFTVKEGEPLKPGPPPKGPEKDKGPPKKDREPLS